MIALLLFDSRCIKLSFFQDEDGAEIAVANIALDGLDK